MNKIPVNWISTYLYCKRKLYLEETRKLKFLSEEYGVKKEIRQKIFNEINSIDKEIVVSIKNFKTLEDIQMIFRRKYYELIQKIIEENNTNLFGVGLNATDFFHEVWPVILEEVNLRSNNLFEFIMREKIYSEELWSKLFPKYLSKVILENDKLIGKADRIEIYSDRLVPIELKDGRAPKEGAWPGDKAQVEIYMQLAEKEFGKTTNYGFVNYLGSEELRKVTKNEFFDDFISILIDDINKTLNGDLPDFVNNRKKCERCPLREKCYAIEK